MKDQRSKDAVAAAIAFGKGEITRKELDAAHAAHAAYAAAKNRKVVRKTNQKLTADIVRAIIHPNL